MRYEEPEVILPELEKLIGKGVRREWTTKEGIILNKYYGKVPVRALAKILGRTVSAVRNKVDREAIR